MDKRIYGERSRNDRVSSGAVILLVCIFIAYLLLGWFISDPRRASSVDKYILYNIDDVFHYCYARLAGCNPLVLLNPYARPVFTFLSSLFLKIIPLGFLSLRIMNIIFSMGVLLVSYMIMKKERLDEKQIYLSIFMTATFPLYFLASVSALAEIMFAFFLTCSIYLAYTRRYFLSIFFASLLPLIRQEGFLFILAWAFFLARMKKRKYIFILFIPSLAWITLNYLLIHRPPVYTLVYPYYLIIHGIAPRPPPQTVGAVFSPTSIFALMLHPLFILSFLGWRITIKDAPIGILSLCWIFYAIFLFVFAFFHIVVFRSAPQGLRYAVPLIPILSFYAIQWLRNVMSRFGQGNFKIKTILIAAYGVAAFSVFPNLALLQMEKKVQEEALTGRQEAAVKTASQWLNSVLTQQDIMNVYVSGKCTTNKIIRRIWMELGGDKRFFPVIPGLSDPKGGLRPLDIVTYEKMRGDDINGIFIIMDITNYDDLGKQAGWMLIKSFPEIPLHFFRVDKKA